MKRSVIVSAIALGCALVAADKPVTVHLAEDIVVAPVDHSQRHLDVEVLINGKGPYPFQVDTYASIDACIDDDLALELGLPKTGTTQNSDGHTTRERDIVTIDELQLGGATFRNLRTLVDDYDFLRDPQGRTVRGLIGFGAFRDLLLTVDYPGSRLVIQRGQLDADEPHVLPFTTPRGSPDVKVRFGDVELSLGIDTGAGMALSLELGDAETLALDGELERVGTARTVYSEHSVHGATLADPVELAGHRLGSVVAHFPEGQKHRLMGYGLLAAFEVTFDQRLKLVRFVDPTEAGAADHR